MQFNLYSCRTDLHDSMNGFKNSWAWYSYEALFLWISFPSTWSKETAKIPNDSAWLLPFPINLIFNTYVLDFGVLCPMGNEPSYVITNVCMYASQLCFWCQWRVMDFGVNLSINPMTMKMPERWGTLPRCALLVSILALRGQKWFHTMWCYITWQSKSAGQLIRNFENHILLIL